MIQPLHLTRRDPAQNMARFYDMGLQPTLFGEVALLRHWGRIGTLGQGKMQTFADEATARLAQNRLAAAKARRGYAADAATMGRAPCLSSHSAESRPVR
jgi:predicted DNA-binding WGR domain protein